MIFPLFLFQVPFINQFINRTENGELYKWVKDADPVRGEEGADLIGYGSRMESTLNLRCILIINAANSIEMIA